MLFQFLKYLQPTNYFALFNKAGESVFPIVKYLPKSVLEQLNPDSKYQSSIAQAYDLSWQALQKGYIGNAETYKSFQNIPITDEYVFIRKYFSLVWVYYVFFIRIFSLKNPFKEIQSLYCSRKVKRSDYLKKPIINKNWDSFKSKLVAENPKVSVIIPTLNRYLYLKDVLADLEKQHYKNFEVLVVDQSDPYQSEFYKDFNLDLKADYQEEKALWLARNEAIKNSEGDYILLFDDDSRVSANWIINHLKCLDLFDADISSGVSISKVGAKVPDNYSFFRIGNQLDTGNVLIHKKVFKDIGLFDRQFEKQRMGDGEFGLRAYISGYINVSNPFAERLHLKVGSGGLREMGSWDGFRPKRLFDPRPIPSVLYLYRKYFKNTAARWSLLKTIPSSIMPYKFKANKGMLIVGVCVSFLLFPFVLFQVNKSWKLSSKKLDEGAKIENLK